MFAPRFDPTLYSVDVDEKDDISSDSSIEQKRKRRLSDTSDEEEESDDSSGESLTSESSSEEEDSNSGDETSESEEDVSNKEPETNDSQNEEHSEPEMVNQDSKKHSDNEEIDEDKMDIDNEDEADIVENDPEYLKKHKSIFKKFQKSIPSHDISESEEEPEEIIETQELAPIPQPDLPRDKRLVSTSAYLKNLDWLTTPIFASPEITEPFEKFALSPFMLKNLKALGFEKAFSTQVSVLKILLEDIKKSKLQPGVKGDVLVNASTGSGKTLAYLIPIIEGLHGRTVPRVRALILVPTKPLITQVKKTLMDLAKGTNLSVVNLRNDISIKDEASKLKSSVPDIIVSTPGRLVEHLNINSIDLKSLRFLVVDEADRLLNQSFQNWCEILISKIPSVSSISEKWSLPVQKLIFSATLTTDAGKLSLLKFHRPRLIIVNNQEKMVNEIFTVPSTLSEFKVQFGTAKSSLKPLILAKMLVQMNKLSNVLVFTKSNEASLRLSKLLSLIFSKLLPEKNMNISYINSTNNSMATRTKILKQFSTQDINILVATDLISRGIDILSITDVINYDLPNSSREYVHRVGRTARANQSGSAYTLVFGKGESKWYKSLMSDVSRDENKVEDFDVEFRDLVSQSDEEVYRVSLEELQKLVFNKSH